MKRKKGFYSISAVAKMFSVHQQTVRLYEKQGLISPKRSAGNTRLFSEEDVDRLEQVIYLTHQLGINLAGVEMILKLQKKIKRMQREMNIIFDDTTEELKKEVLTAETVIKSQVKELVKTRKNATTPAPAALGIEDKTKKPGKPTAERQNIFETDNWKIEYED